MTPRDDDAFEVLLTGALQDCAGVEPRDGLDRRILARVRAEQVAPIRNWFWRYAAMAVPLIAVMAFVTFHQGQHKPAERVLVENRPVVVESRVAAAKPAKQHAVTPKAAAETALPKQDVFPAPVAAPVEARALSEWTQQHPQEAGHLLRLQQADSASAELNVEPIHIATIEVPPLTH